MAVRKPLTEFQVAYNEQANNVLDVTQNSYDRPRQGREAADRRRAGRRGHAGAHDLLHQLARAAGLPLPRLREDGRAGSRHRLRLRRLRENRKIVAWGGTTPDDEETGLGGARRQPRVVLRPLGRPRGVGAAATTSTTPTSTATTWPTTGSRSSWEYGSYRPASALPRDLGKVVRYVGLNLLFASSPLYPPYFTADRAAGARRPRRQHRRGLAGVNASSAVRQAATSSRQERELPAGYDARRATTRTSPSRATSGAATVEWLVGGRRASGAYADYSPDANLFLSRGAQPRAGSSTASRTTRRRSSTTRSATTRRRPAARLRGRQLARRHPERRLQLRLARASWSRGYGLTTTMIHEYGHHSSLSHPHDGYDSATGRRLRADGRLLLRLAGRRVELDDELHRPQLGLQPVRPRQLGPPPRGGLRADRQPDRRRHPAQPPDATARPRDLEAADRELVAAQPRPAGPGLRRHARPRRGAPTGTCGRAPNRADVPVVIRRPSTWTVPGGGRAARLPDEAGLDRPPRPREPESRGGASRTPPAPPSSPRRRSRAAWRGSRRGSCAWPGR